MLRCVEMKMFITVLWELHFLNRLRLTTVRYRHYLMGIRQDFVNQVLDFVPKIGCGWARWLGSIFECYIHWAGVALFWEEWIYSKFGNTENWNCERIFITLEIPHEEISEKNLMISEDELSISEEMTRGSWVTKLQDCLKKENSVQLCMEGVGGTYWIGEDQQWMGVFKPVDEEPGAQLNPKGSLTVPLMPPGGGAIREVAAFLLDTDGFAGVPETLLLRNVYHPQFNNNNQPQLISKTGSLQKFVQNIGNSESMGSNCFSIQDVHHLGILDIRLLNMDRNGENILLVKDEMNSIRLVPIDHSYTLPETLGDFYFEWQYWRQAKIPFDSQALQFIRDIDIEADSIELARLGISDKAIMYMRLASLLLKKGAAAGLSLFDIAGWISPEVTAVSQFSKIVEKSYAACGNCCSNGVEKLFEKLLDELIGSCVES